MGLDRESVYMTNILKWRPEHDKPYGNRPPTQEEMNFCLPYLKAQIEIVQPKVIIGLGNATVPGLLGPDPSRKMASMRGTWQTFEGTPLIFTFQPAYLLFNDTMKTKRMAWEDMLKAMEKAGLPISEKQKGFFLPK
jgi:DNA polymerase